MFFQDSLLLSPVFWLAWSFLVLAFVTYWYNVIGKSVSTILNAYLHSLYPIKSANGMFYLPSCSYQWPNGQGDTAKFLRGEKNGEAWRRRHGDIYRVWSGMTPEIVLTRPEDVQRVFVDSDQHTKARNNNSGWLMGELLGQCVGLISHNNWKTLRSITEAPFIHREMAHNIGYIEGRTRKHIEFLQSRSKLSEGVLNPVEDLKILPFRLVAHIIYGDLTTDMEARLERMIDVRESIFQGVISGGITRFWWYKYLPTSMNRDLAHFKEEWSDFNNMARQQAVSVPISRFYQNVELGTITLIQMLQTVDEILFANLDVTMGGISWVLMFLASNPDVQGDLRKEIMANLSGTQDTHAYLLRSTTFLHATIMEASRLKPLAPFTIPQSAPTDRHVGGFVIPAGTNFIVDSYALNTHNPYWGKDSKTYRPARWLERNVTKSRYNFWRFGFGPRGCMGKHTADLIIRVLLVQLLKDYELFLIDEQTTWVKNDVTWITHPDTVLGCQRIST